MTRHQDNASERILDGFEDLLNETAGPQVTLEAVAAHVDLTKGGLLYHFPSRAALIEALIERYQARTRDDLTEMNSAPEGAVASYLRISDYLVSPLHRTTLALHQLSATESAAVRALAQTRESELELLTRDVKDPRLARLTLLLAEGLAREAIARRSSADTAEMIEWYLRDALPKLTELVVSSGGVVAAETHN